MDKSKDIVVALLFICILAVVSLSSKYRAHRTYLEGKRDAYIEMRIIQQNLIDSLETINYQMGWEAAKELYSCVPANLGGATPD